jgi:chromosome segregation ATPase
MQEADRLKDEAVDLAEKQQDSIYSDRMHEFTALQAKVMTIQGQLQEAYTETATAQQREDSSRAEKARMTAHQITLRTEIDGLKGQLQSVRDEREQEVQQTGTKHSQEATVRRLDNERQYLKSQLASEITLKNELHEALFQCQQQLGETQTQWKSDVETLKESTSKVVQDASFAQQRSYQTAISLEAEVGRLGVQNRDLKEGFTQMRDQVRMEQLTIENSSTVNRRLQEQLEALKAEGVRALQAGNVEGRRSLCIYTICILKISLFLAVIVIKLLS